MHNLSREERAEKQHEIQECPVFGGVLTKHWTYVQGGLERLAMGPVRTLTKAIRSKIDPQTG